MVKKGGKAPVILVALDWYNRDLHRGIARWAREAGCSLDASAQHSMDFRDIRADGVITLIAGGAPLRRLIKKTELPIINIGGDSRAGDLPGVSIDHVACGKAIAAHFLERRFRHFAACVRGRPGAKSRVTAFRSDVEAAGFTCTTLCAADAETTVRRQGLRRWFAKRLKSLPKPLAVMAQNDDAALMVLDACLLAGLRVPEEVAVIGCDNDALVCESARVPLSSLDPGLEACGYEAGRLMGRRLEGEHITGVRELPPVGVVVRASSDMVAIAHQGVARAYHFISENFRDPGVRLDDVARAAGLSVTGLNLAFKKALHRTAGEQLRTMRFDAARQLLLHTRLPLQEIATSSGYRDERHLRDAVRRETGKSPREWRREKKVR